MPQMIKTNKYKNKLRIISAKENNLRKWKGDKFIVFFTHVYNKWLCKDILCNKLK